MALSPQLSLLLLLSLFVSGEKSWSGRVVTTKQGLTRGFLFSPRGFEPIEVFLGLPYASAPVGSLRLMPPVSGSPWSGTKMNSDPPPACPQVLPSLGAGVGESEYNETEALRGMSRGRLSGLRRLLPFLRNQSEDCLYLNVHVPGSVAEGKVDGLVPVLMFIQGEDFSYGAGHPYDPSILVSQAHVIVITLNFRLGILGFLNANSDGYFKAPANFALLDQLAALQWVQENIEAFGGDKTNVTLMGHGKGAMFVNFLMISNALPSFSEGRDQLFHRVILMSGSALSPITVGLSYGRDLAKKFAGRFNCPLEPPSNMLQCLRQLPLQYFLDSDLWRYFGPSDDGIVIEGVIKENIFMERVARFPLLFGVTKAEFLPNLSEQDASYGIETEKRREVLKLFIDGFYSSAYRAEILAAAVHEYTDWERPIQHPISVRDETLDALADAQIVAPLVKVGELHAQASGKTFFYVFEYQSKSSDFIQQKLGCVPGEDLAYVFGVPLLLTSSATGWGEEEDHAHSPGTATQFGVFTGNFTRNEVQLSQAVMQYWANFLKTGNPNGDSEAGGLTHDKGGKSKLIEWPVYDSLYKKYLSIEAKPRPRNHYRAHKLSFWLHLVPELMRSGGNGGPGGGISLFQGRNEVQGGNSSAVQHPPVQLVGSSYWEHNNYYYSGSNNSDISGPLGSTPRHPHLSSFHYNLPPPESGFQIYSTALSVTIAVGCSLLILNILLFAAFYYFRDKRSRESQSQGSGPATHAHNNQGMQESHYQLQGPGQGEHYQSGAIPDLHPVPSEHLMPTLHQSHSTPLRENGQVPSALPGDLPLSTLQALLQQSPSSSTLSRRGNHNDQSQSQSQQFELSMPDAILAAAMMLNYRQAQQGQVQGQGQGQGQRRKQGPPPMNMKEQLLQDPEAAKGRRPGTTVKFSDTFVSPDGSLSSSNSTQPGPPPNPQLKSSLKKHSNYQQQK